MTAETTDLSRHALPDGRLIACTHEHDPLGWSGLLEDSPYDDGLDELAAGDVILDVGAHIGLTSLYFRHRVPGVRLIAFEPAPLSYACLADNFARLLPDATALNVAIGAEPGEAELTVYPNHTMMATLHVNDADDEANLTAVLDNWQVDPAAREEFWRDFRAGIQHITVPVRTLADVIDEYRIERVGLLKIDVERAELDVLRGIRDDQWDRIRQLVVEVHDIEENLSEVRATLAEHGFTCRAFQEPLFAGGSVHIVFATREARDCNG
ncbi:MAG: FkbM family methyltransferase [Actinocatenispora sp.]